MSIDGGSFRRLVPKRISDSSWPTTSRSNCCLVKALALSPSGKLRTLDIIGMGEEGTGYLCLGRVPVCLLIGQGIPDADQQLPGNSHLCLLFGHSFVEPPELRLPVRVLPLGDLRHLDHRMAQVFPSRPGNLSILRLLPLPCRRAP